MNRIKILFTIPNFISAGSGREMFNIIERLDNKLFDVNIAVQQAGGKLYDEVKSRGYNVLEQPFFADSSSGLVNKIVEAIRLANTFTKYHFDIWQSFNWSSDFTEAIVARLAGARFCYVKKNMNWNRKAWKIKSFLSDRIIARNTTMMESFFSYWMYRKKTKLITGGVDTSKFIPDVTSDIRRLYNIPPEAKLVCCIAQLVRLKDQLTLIKAISGIENIYLILAGAEQDIQYAKELRTLIKELNVNNRVIIAGNVNRINDLLNSSNIFVLPTSRLYGHEEGCPVSLLEAMCAGTPVIASNVAGNRDLVTHEQTGLLFEPGNVDELANHIKRYLEDIALAKNVSAKARTKILVEHTLDIEAEAFSNLYKTISR